jgi:ribonuclease PH
MVDAGAMSIRRRAPGKMRSVKITPNAAPFAEGSALIAVGKTQVLCTASIEEGVPPWRKGSGAGWVTAEYAMLPRATSTRTHRERSKVGGRTAEIQRLIGRALRGVVDMERLGERSIFIDCDVLQADGGTRTAAVTGGYVALARACQWLVDRGAIARVPLIDSVAAVSVGIVGGRALLDLEYTDDVAADVDMNIVMTGKGKFIEIQGTAEHAPFDGKDLDRLLRLARRGIRALEVKQSRAIR